MERIKCVFRGRLKTLCTGGQGKTDEDDFKVEIPSDPVAPRFMDACPAAGLELSCEGLSNSSLRGERGSERPSHPAAKRIQSRISEEIIDGFWVRGMQIKWERVVRTPVTSNYLVEVPRGANCAACVYPSWNLGLPSLVEAAAMLTSLWHSLLPCK